MLAKVDPQHREFLMRELASLRLTVQGAPLREHFERLVAGTCAPGPVEAHCSRPGQLYFMQPRHGAVAVTFPVRFSSPFDACTGRAFLHEFAEARREPVLGRAPSCSYSQQPPAELQGVDPSTLADVNGGYVSFTFNERHVHGPQMPHVVWSMCSFYFLISCHLKACKAAMNAKMRSSMDAMCTELRSHRVPWEATQL
ncbi:hypothetical protein FOA52_007673 [Chlamydomonas sp. UWO 241]|nr:hypothetical protein FOA52_007673 [Chlamydomonas sp. UWO 241]